MIGTVRVSTHLDVPADRAWELARRSDTFRYVTRGVLGFRSSEPLPEVWRQGGASRGRLVLFHLVPGWTHEIRITAVDSRAREIRTQEAGGPVTAWNHRIRIQPEGDGCRYTDEVRISAGMLTPLVWAYARVVFRYRQMRWRRLARASAG